MQTLTRQIKTQMRIPLRQMQVDPQIRAIFIDRRTLIGLITDLINDRIFYLKCPEMGVSNSAIGTGKLD